MNATARNGLLCAALAVIAAALAGCGGGATIGVTHAPSATPVPQSTGSPVAIVSAMPAPSPTATTSTSASATPSPASSASPVAPPPGDTSTSSIYLGDIAQGAVLIYSSNANGSVSPSAIIAGSNTGFTDSTGSSAIYGIAVDEGGTVYVLTQTTDSTRTTIVAESILAFPAGTTGNVAPARTIALPTSIDAESLAYAHANLYVTDQSGTGAIDVYASNAGGAATPVRTFTDSSAFPNLPLKVSVDSSGNAYVSTYDQTATATTEATQGVYAFAPSASGSTTPENTLSGSNTGFGNGVLEGAAIDANGVLDAVLQDSASDITADIDEFVNGATGNAMPALTFQDATSQGPVDVAVDASRNLYVSEVANSTAYAQVNIFGPGAKTPQQTIEAYDAELPLIAIGPYVAASPSGAMPVSLHHRSAQMKARLRRAIHVRALRIAAR